MRRVLPIAVAAAALCLSQLPAQAAVPTGVAQRGADPSAAVVKQAAPRDLVRTKFAVSSTAYGSRIQGGMIPANSDTTAWQSIGCTNLVGQVRTNYVAEAELPGVGLAEGVSSRVWNEKVGTRVSSYAMHKIAKVTIGDPQFGSIQITGLSSFSHAFNKDGKFGTKFENSIARITLTPPGGGAPQVLDLPAPNEPIVIPGLLSLEIGKVVRKVTNKNAKISTNVLDVTVIPSETRTRVAQSIAEITGGVAAGIFQGFATAVTGKAAEDNIRVGRVPLIRMPCNGTPGQIKDTARVDLNDQIVARGLATAQRGVANDTEAFGIERAQVAQISLGDGRLVINGIVGQVNVSRNGTVVKRDTKGTQVLEGIFEGESFAFPDFGTFEIPGLAKFQSGITTKIPDGIRVIALRITLLDGSGAVIDLGTAQLAIKPGVRR